MYALGIQSAAVAATNETVKADADRRKPLQRCDQLAEKAQLDCLQKARERVVEARSKREAAAEKGPAPGERQEARKGKSDLAEKPGTRPDAK
jgi:hypothetical protein